MLAVIGDPVIQTKALEAFHPLGKHGWVRPWESPGHLDGWGMVTYTPQGPEYIARSGGDVDVEAHVYAAASAKAVTMDGRLILVHFRKATNGEKIPDNAHPFISGRWVFCHNGTIIEMDKLGPCPPLHGTTDSEEFFRRWCAQGKDIAGYRHWIDGVASTCGYTALTSFLTDGERLMACRRSSGTLCYPAPDKFDPACLECSYTVHHWTRDGAHVLCSEVLPGFAGPWHDFANGECLMLTL